MIEKYLKPKSLSWWSAVTMAGIAVAGAYGMPIKPEVYALVAALFGIGFRGAVK